MLQEVIVNVRKGEKLSDVLKRRGYDEIPANCIINKMLPGLGITHCELVSERDSIIVEPNVPVIKKKMERYKRAFGMYEGISSQDVANYLLSQSIPFKKILITPDSFFKIKEIMEELYINMYESFFLLLDECERHFPLDVMRQDFFRFRNRSFVASSPVISSDPLMRENGFYTLTIKPDYEYRQSISLIATNNVAETLLANISGIEGPVCIFCHSLDTVNSLLSDIPLLRKEGRVFEGEKPLSHPCGEDFQPHRSYVNRLGNYNLFTSHYFLAVDIEFPVRANVILISDLFSANPSFIDPATDAMQIAGRLRGGIKSMTHISNIDPELSFYTPKQARTWLKNAGKIYMGWVRKMESVQHEGARAILREAVRQSTYSRFVDKAGNINPLSITKFIDSETVKGLYTNVKLLQEAYSATKHFDVTLLREVHIFSDKDRLLLNHKLTQEGRNRLLLTRFEQLEVLRKARSSKAQMRYRHLIDRLLVNPSDNFLYQCFMEYGSNFIRNAGYKEVVMRKEINKLLTIS
ncbi:MAG: hypothetical protein LBI58_03495 [Tannerellaceae bacterium]|jgi:hypothetical protein|nr:hypothetical protein [Tannerellaceae bacterium]